MKVAVLELWHLGWVTATCCASHFKVTGLDPDSTNISRIKKGAAPLFKSGLNELIAALMTAMSSPIVIDATRFSPALKFVQNPTYLTVDSPA